MDYVVALTIADVKRIAGRTNTKPESFIDFSSVDRMEFKCPDVRVDGGYFYMTLRRDERGCCIFSVLSGDDIKCSIHGSHPLPCRIYPYTEAGGKVVHRRKFRCERKWDMDKENLDRVRGLLDLREKEIREYEPVAREWNALGGGSRRDFLSFIF